jgi:hypothetical protein
MRRKLSHSTVWAGIVITGLLVSAVSCKDAGEGPTNPHNDLLSSISPAQMTAVAAGHNAGMEIAFQRVLAVPDSSLTVSGLLAIFSDAAKESTDQFFPTAHAGIEMANLQSHGIPVRPLKLELSTSITPAQVFSERARAIRVRGATALFQARNKPSSFKDTLEVLRSLTRADPSLSDREKDALLVGWAIGDSSSAYWQRNLSLWQSTLARKMSRSASAREEALSARDHARRPSSGMFAGLLLAGPEIAAGDEFDDAFCEEFPDDCSCGHIQSLKSGFSIAADLSDDCTCDEQQTLRADGEVQGDEECAGFSIPYEVAKLLWGDLGFGAIGATAAVITGCAELTLGACAAVSAVILGNLGTDIVLVDMMIDIIFGHGS